MSNPNSRVLTNQQFYGGQSSDPAVGPAGSFSYSRALDHRSNPSQLKVLPGPRKISAGVVNDLILNIVQVNSGDRYAYGDQGNIYKIDTNNVVTYVNKLSVGSDGMLYRTDTDAICFATDRQVQRYYPVSSSPTFDILYGPTKSVDSHAYRTGGAASYSVPSTLKEGEKLSFQPDIEPFYSMKFNVVDKGSGSWTLTLHDGLNNTLATVTIPAASMGVGLVEFRFSSQIRALVKPNARTYHAHLASSNGTGTVRTATAADLNTADFELWADLLVQTNNGLHPMAQFQQFTVIGNGRYLAVWEPLSDGQPSNAEFQRHRLVFPSGFEVCGVAVTDEFLVVAIAKYATNGSKDFQEGKLILWDGAAQTYNQVVDVPNGAPESITTDENYPYFFAGGHLCAWGGGKNIIKVRKLANTASEYRDAIDSTRVYPNMMTVRDGILHAGYPSVTTNVAVEHGVYLWGSIEKNYPSSFNFGYAISTQTVLNTAGTLQLGCVRNFGDEMYLSWKDGTSYGLDIVDSYCDPAPVFKWRARRFDAASVRKTKMASGVGIDMAPLPDGVAITPTYQVDSDAEVQATDYTTDDVGSTEIIGKFGETQRFKRITYGFDGTSSGSSPATVYGISLEWNALANEKSM